jgi:hypothetical protein
MDTIYIRPKRNFKVCGVGRTVVDYDHLEVPEGLAEDGV